MTEDEKKKIMSVIAGQSIADHLGDVRDEETALWELLGVTCQQRHEASNYESPFQDMKHIASVHGLTHLLPDWVGEGDE